MVRRTREGCAGPGDGARRDARCSRHRRSPGEAEVRSYWQLAVGVADSLLVLVVVAAGALVMSHETLQSNYALKDLLPRLTVAAIASNASLAICGQMVNIANVLSTALLGNGVEPQQAGHTLELLVLHSIADGGIFLILLGCSRARCSPSCCWSST